MADAKIKIGIIGAGNVGWHLTRAFYAAGVDITLCSSGADNNLLNDFPNAKVVRNVTDLPRDLNVVFFVRRDADLMQTMAVLSKNNTIVHCSGSMHMQVLSEFEHFGVLYPLQSFRKGVMVENDDFPVFIEAGDEKTKQLLFQLAQWFSKKVLYADSKTRLHFHLSGVLSSNFVNYLYAAAFDLVPDVYNAHEVLLPLMKETVMRLKSGLPDRFQTGPALRYDEVSIAKHLELLSNDEELQKLYQLITQLIQKRHV